MELVYKISNNEINRRTRAYTTLIISFFIGIIIFSFNYIMLYFNIFIFILLILAILLFYSRFTMGRYFKSILDTKVVLNEDYIIKNKTKYSIKNIKKVVIKRTIKGDIREIKLILNNRITYVNNEIEDVEEFLKKLQKYLPKNVIEKNIKEPIDYDHPTFYLFFGLLLSFISVESIKLFLNLNNQTVCLIYYFVTLISILFGTYFMIYKPIHKRNETANKNADYIWGAIFSIGGILVLLTTAY